jgi:hypothetical protein
VSGFSHNRHLAQFLETAVPSLQLYEIHDQSQVLLSLHYYLAMLKQLEKLREDFGPFMPGLEKQDGLMVVFSMAEMVSQIKFRTKLYEVQRAAKVDDTGSD